VDINLALSSCVTKFFDIIFLINENHAMAVW
jgi:hypothetical protein